MKMNKLYTFLVAFAFTLSLGAQTSLPTSWNFSSPGITTPPNGWTLVNQLTGGTGGQTYAFGIGDNLSCRFDAAGEYLTINFADKPGVMTYYVSPQNAGNTWTGVFDVQQSADGSNWTSVKQFTTWPSTVTNFTNGKQTETGLLSTTRFVRFMLTTKTAGNFALDSVLIQAAPAAATPSINLKQSSTNIVTGSEFVVGKAANTAFTIENKGTAQTLTVSAITFTGPAAGDYSVSGKPDSVVALSSGNFTLNFNPAANTGSRKAVMHIATNDPDKADYTVNLYGIGGSYATQPSSTVAQLNINNVTACGMDVSFVAPGTAPEHYILLRKKGGVVFEVPVDGVTYQRGDYIGNAQVAYIGDTVTTYRPTHTWANTTYGYAVFCFNGPKGFENYMPGGVTAAQNTPGKNIGTYYNGIKGSDSTLVSKLTAKINPHDTVFYSQYISRFVQPFITRDTSAGKKVVNCVYTGLPQIYTEPFVWWNGTNGATLTREHSYPQSWMPSRSAPNWPNANNGKEFPEYNDMHHLFPADQTNGNGVRSNYPLGEVVSNPQPSPSGLGILGKDANGATVYEPRDEHKGDVARAIFYMCTAYHGINGLNWSLPASQDQAVLKKWHFQDLPDNWEIARHEFVFSQQHNRNPFIDSVNFACHIDFSNMSFIANPGNCGTVGPPPSSITIKKPIGGEFYDWSTNTDTVMWTSTNIDSIQIQLYVNDVLINIIATVPAASGMYVWNIESGISSNKCKMKLQQVNGTTSSVSPAYFTIARFEGLNEMLDANAVNVFPNPSNGKVNIQLNGNNKLDHLTLRDITGRTLYTTTNSTLEISKAGIYFVEVATEKGNVVKKIVVE